MPCEIEFWRLRIFFMQWSSNKPLNFVFLQGLHCRNKRFNGIFSPCFRKLARINAYFFFPAVKQVDLFMVDAGKIFYILITEIHFRYSLTIKINYFIGSKNNGGAQFKDTVI